jgi:hypothetical protein
METARCPTSVRTVAAEASLGRPIARDARPSTSAAAIATVVLATGGGATAASRPHLTVAARGA